MSIRQIVDESRLSPLQIVVIGVCFFLNMLDGMDVLAISFAAPVIAEDWGISRSALGIAFSAALVGMALGAVVISPYTDVIGRRRMVLLSTVVISLGMAATAFAQSVTQLVVLRLVAGLGIGSMLASLTSMVSEYAPDRHRNFSILLLHSAYPVGSIFAGIVASWILPEYGWRALFVLAATVSTGGHAVRVLPDAGVAGVPRLPAAPKCALEDERHPGEDGAAGSRMDRGAGG